MKVGEFYWVRLYTDWTYEGRKWSNPSDEWTVAHVEYGNGFNASDTDLVLMVIGDECSHGMDEVYDKRGPIEAPK